MDILEKLPIEIFYKVLDYLNIKDIKNYFSIK